MTATFPTLYKRTSTGATQIWKIIVDGPTYYTKSGQIEGKIKQSKPTVCKAMNVGKSNETTPEEQAVIEAQAKFDKQLKSKYNRKIEDIDCQSFISPTLASPLKKRAKPLVFPALIQTKYNGVCCIIDKEFGSRSRKGEVFYNLKHINKSLEPFFIKNPDVVLHGELFNYEMRRNLNRLVRLVAVTRKEKDLDGELIRDSEEIVQFWVYDGYTKGEESKPYHERIVQIHEKIKGVKYLFPAPTTVVNNEDEIQEFFMANLADGQEGAIVKMMNMPYLHKRTTDIIKFKESDSKEFKVIAFVEGNGDWTGCAKKATCLMDSGETFNSNIYGTMEFLKYALENEKEFLQKIYTVDFQCESEYGVPQLPWVNIEIPRDYE
jgi:ATP-dependent DNA ligase